MAIKSIDQELCIGCGTCVEICIMDVLRTDEASGKAVIQYPDECMSCNCCEVECPSGAVTISIIEKPQIMSWG